MSVPRETDPHPPTGGQPDRPAPVVIGLVGGIGSGKSEVARLIAERGGVVVDADRIGHELLREPAVKEEVRRRWGSGVFGADGEVDRGRLAEAVFSGTGDERPGIEALNEIVHPDLVRRVGEDVARARGEGRASWIVVDAALLLEWGLEGVCDAVIFVDAPEAARRGRVAEARGWSAEEVTRREGCQVSLEEKRTRSQRVLQNSGSREALTAAVEELLVALGRSVRAGA